MVSLEDDRTSLIAVAIGIVAAAVALYLLRNRKTRFGLHLPLHPSSPRPGTVPRRAHGLRLRSW